MNLSPAQRKMLFIGVPVIAALALFTVLRKKTVPAHAAPAGTTTATTQPANGVDPGQLADWETQMAHAFGDLQHQVANLQTPSATPTSGTTTATAPVAQSSAPGPISTPAAGPPANYVNPMYGTVVGTPPVVADPGNGIPAVLNFNTQYQMGDFQWPGNDFFGSYAQAQAAGYTGPPPPNVTNGASLAGIHA